MASSSAPLLERTASTADAVEQRARVRAKVGPKRGEHGLDIGCGPGLLACELARDVGPHGKVVGIDASPDMVVMSADRARRSALAGRTEFAVGDPAELNFPAQNFDFATAVHVYEFVADLPRALDEAYRVLKPGGLLVLMATDWDSCVWQVDDPGRHADVMRAWDAHFVHPHLPALLPRLLGHAGFGVRSLSVVPVVNLHADDTTYSGSVIDVIAGFASRNAGIPDDVAQGWADDVRGQDLHGRYFFSLSGFLFLAERPVKGG
ncbi:MAG TPA: methyltransferase domain-containing protein [Methylomirabilota bacterium]